MKKQLPAKKAIIEDDAYLKRLGKRIKDLRIKKRMLIYTYFTYENNIGRAQYCKLEKAISIRL
jgi:hypothetical protein